MNKRSHGDFYDDREGNTHDLSTLDKEERELIEDLVSFANQHPDARTGEYRNYYVRRVGGFYEARGLSRSQVIKTAAWQIAQDIYGRLLVASGIARDSGDYRDELDDLIRKEFGSRRKFCEATGVSEDMLSHVLAKRKDFGIQTLADALAKVGYTLHITEFPDIAPPMSK